ncbi:MAG: hypothetical protein HY897_17825 [Deltaproteobacteria bacterium]|nr:hypothetical protein [Deltaproteobacteria bacterium]
MAQRLNAGAMVVAVVAGLFPAAAGAGTSLPDGLTADELIKDAVNAYEAMDYDRALPLLSEAERLPGLSKIVRITILKYRAFILILEGKEILARDAVTVIYDLKPDFELPQTVAPKFRIFFAGVREDYKPKTKPKKAQTDRILTVQPVPPAPAPRVQRTSPPAPEAPNWFVRWWPSWTCLAAGTALAVPGVIIGLDVKSGQDELKNAQRDDAGHIIGMTYDEAKSLQNEADKKGLTSTILLGAGGAVVAAGIALFFVYDGAAPATGRTSVSVSPGTDGRSLLLHLGGGF